MTFETTDSEQQTTNPEWDAEAALKRIEAISVNARTTWFGLLALLTFVLVTLLGVQHIDFFGYGRATQLPLVNVSVPTERFFYAAPVLVAAVYAYFHFYLMKLWDELGQAEPQIDGRPIGDLVFPWLVVDGAMLLRTDGAAPRRALSRVSAFTSLTLTWLFGLAVLAYGLWQSLPAHDPVMSLINCAALLFAGWVGVTSYIVMRRRLKYRMFGPRTEHVWNGWRWVLGGAFCIAAMVMVWERSTNGASRFASDMWLTGVERKAEAADWSGDLTRKRHLAVTPWVAIAPIDLAEAQLTEKPSDWLDKATAERDFRKRWCGRQELPWAMCVKDPDDQQMKARFAWCRGGERSANGTVGQPRLTSVGCSAYFREQETAFQEEWGERRREYLSVLTKPVLKGRNLRGSNLQNAFLPGIDLGESRLEKAHLGEARLEGADLGGAHLEGANLRWTQLEGANLEGAWLERADLSWARLEEAKLIGARLERAKLIGARLEGAHLGDARLQRANLSGARLDRATVIGARLQGANFKNARLQGANLAEALLEGADLSRAWLEGANFHRALLKWANLSGARLEGAYLDGAQFQLAEFSGATIGSSPMNYADFSGAKNLTQDMLEQAVGDADTILPRVDGTPLYVWSCWVKEPVTFDALLSLWPERTHFWLRRTWLCGPEGRKKTGRTALP